MGLSSSEDPMIVASTLNRFNSVPACDRRRTDRQTDGFTIANTAMLTRCKNFRSQELSLP